MNYKKNIILIFSHADATEKEEVLQLSAEVNKGYMTFQSADITLSYFLQTIGVLEIGEKYDLPAEFLMDMMDINESFTENETVAINEVKKQEEKLWEEIKPVIQNYSEANRETTNLQKLKEYYYKKKYLQRILDRLAD